MLGYYYLNNKMRNTILIKTFCITDIYLETLCFISIYTLIC